MNDKKRGKKVEEIKMNLPLIIVSLTVIILGLFFWFRYNQIYYLIFALITVALLVFNFLYKRN